jgi:outer membrane protein assembly factor BamB
VIISILILWIGSVRGGASDACGTSNTFGSSTHKPTAISINKPTTTTTTFPTNFLRASRAGWKSGWDKEMRPENEICAHGQKLDLVGFGTRRFLDSHYTDEVRHAANPPFGINPMRQILAIVGLVVSIESAFGGENWPQFRGPNGDGISDAKNLPITWSETENIRWKTAIHGKAWSSPVVWGQQIWMTSATEDGKESFVICVDHKTGKIVHDINLFTTEKPAFCIPYNSYASPTPVIEDGRLYAHFGSACTACVDTATGKTLWMRRDLPCDHWRSPGSSPVLYKNLLILTFDGYDQQYMAALDKETGKTVWRKDRTIKYTTDNGDLKKAYSTPSILELDGKPQLISPAAEATTAYDPLTGEELWRVYHGGMNAACRPVFGHGLVYLTSGHTKNLLAVKQGGSGDLNKESIAWKLGRGVPSRPSLLLIDDLLYMVSDDGTASCVEAKTGRVVWNERLNAAFSGSPVYAAGRIYLSDESGKSFVLTAGTKFKIESTNKLDAGCMASPVVVGDTLLLRTKTHLYCIGKR